MSHTTDHTSVKVMGNQSEVDDAREFILSFFDEAVASDSEPESINGFEPTGDPSYEQIAKAIDNLQDHQDDGLFCQSLEGYSRGPLDSELSQDSRDPSITGQQRPIFNSSPNYSSLRQIELTVAGRSAGAQKGKRRRDKQRRRPTGRPVGTVRLRKVWVPLGGSFLMSDLRPGKGDQAQRL